MRLFLMNLLSMSRLVMRRSFWIFLPITKSYVIQAKSSNKRRRGLRPGSRPRILETRPFRQQSDESVVFLCWRLIREGERPMWKPEHRIAADGSGLRYPSDLTGAEWAVVEPMVPPAKPGGRKRTIDVREILNGIFYVLWTGCQWQALPKDLPPKSTVWAYFDLWVREQAGREASPTTAIIDSQSVKGAQKGGLA